MRTYSVSLAEELSYVLFAIIRNGENPVWMTFFPEFLTLSACSFRKGEIGTFLDNGMIGKEFGNPGTIRF
jgi:hypothetical protein